MPDISDTTIPYEILIRFDGPGQVAGAHLIARRIVRIDGETIRDEIGQPMPVPAGGALDDVLGAALGQALATLAAKDAEIARLQAGQPVPAPAPAARAVPKLAIIDRLAAAGLFEAAFQALGGPGSLLYERWQAAENIDADNPEVRALLSAIGADPDAILAP